MNDYNMKLKSNNSTIEIYADSELNEDFINRIIKHFDSRKSYLEDFFDKKDDEEIIINLFSNRDNFFEYVGQFVKISTYCTGAICKGEICVFLDINKLDNYGSAGYMIATMIHEYVHSYYKRILHGNEEIWLEEGMATFFSGQKSAHEDPMRYEAFLRKMSEMEIPKLEYLKERGSKYGQFCDQETNKYNGYDFSYLIIKAIFEEKGKEYLKEIIMNKNELEKFELEIETFIKNYIVKKLT